MRPHCHIFVLVLALSISIFSLGCDSSGSSKTMDAGRDVLSSSNDAPAADTLISSQAGNGGMTGGSSGSTGAGGMGHGGTAGSATDAGAAGTGGPDAMVDAKIEEDAFGEPIAPGGNHLPCPPDPSSLSNDCTLDSTVNTSTQLRGKCIGSFCCYGCIRDGVCYRGNVVSMCGSYGYGCYECGGADPNVTDRPFCKPVSMTPMMLQYGCSK